jgi:Ca2+-binding RTX toxin-like protein
MTANGKAEVHLIGRRGLESSVKVKGPDGSLLVMGTQVSVRELAIDSDRSAYVVALRDADLKKTGAQAFGRYDRGALTGNGPASGDGKYMISLGGVDVADFTVKTRDLTRSERDACVVALFVSNGSHALDSLLEGHRVIQSAGTVGDDVLVGVAKSDALSGGGGSDVLNGFGDRLTGAAVSGTFGRGQRDTLIGGAGDDFFQLGDVVGSFYVGGGKSDYALIKDFSKGDSVLLAGSVLGAGYTVGAVTVDGVSGTGIQKNGDLVAVLQGPAAKDFALSNLNQVSFI